MTHRSPWIFAGAALALALFADLLFFKAEGFGLNLFLFQTAFVAFCYALARLTGRRLPHEGWIAAVFACAFAATFALWRSSYGVVFASLGLLLSDALFVLALVYPSGKPARQIFDYVSLGVRAIGRWLNGLSAFSSLRIHRLRAPNAAALRGVGISLVALAVFISLFSAADGAFGKASEKMFSWIEDLFGQNAFGHVLFVAIVFVAYFALFAAAFHREHAATGESSAERAPSNHTEALIVLGVLNALFLVFLVVQAVYLFGGEATLRSIGLTYAEYARKGFGELTAVAVLVLLLSTTLRFFHGSKPGNRLNALHLGLLLQTCAIAASAAMRLSLYVQAYGWTPSRLFGFWMLAVLAGLIVLYAAHILLARDQAAFFRQGFVLVGAAALFFIALRTDALALQLNLSAGRAVEPGDFVSLADDAVPTVRAAYASGRVQTADGQTYPSPTNECVQKAVPIVYADGDVWQAWNLARSRLTRCP